MDPPTTPPSFPSPLSHPLLSHLNLSQPRMPDRPRSLPPSPPPPPTPTPHRTRSAPSPPSRRPRPPTPPHTRQAAQLAIQLQTACQTPEETLSALHALSLYTSSPTHPLAHLHRQQALDSSHALQHLIHVTGLYHEIPAIQSLTFSHIAAWRLHPASARPVNVDMSETVELILSALRTHCALLSVLTPALAALAALAGIPHVRASVLPRCNAIGVVVDVLRGHPSQPGLHADAARFFSRAALRCEGNKSDIAHNGALDLLAAAVRAERAHARLHCANSLALRNVTVCRADVVAYAGKLGLVKDLVWTIDKHGAEECTARHALAALFHLVNGDGGENATRVCRVDRWAEVLCGAARLHAATDCVQILVFGIAGILVRVGGEDAARGLMRAGAVQLALEGMHQHVTSRGLLYYGARMLSAVLDAAGAGMDLVGECGGVDRLLDLLYCSAALPKSDVGEVCAGYAEVL